MIKNAICQHTLPYYHLSIHLFDQKKIFDELTSMWWRQRFPCGRSRAAATTEEEASVEAAAEEIGSSDIDGGGGERWELRKF
jgi:hypothetical protein